MTDFILIHGGFHGAWCWEPLIAELRKQGARGFACDLPGHGENLTPRAQVTRESYVSTVNEFINSLPVERFTLVGHSLAGIILPDIAAAFPERVSEVVFVAALVLSPGERGIDLIPESRRPSYYELAQSSDDYTLWIDFEKAKNLFLNDLHDQKAREIYEKLTPQPFQVYLDRGAKVSLPCPARYLVCDKDQALPPQECLRWAKKLAARIEHIDSGHDVMQSNPKKLAEMLLA